MNFSFKILIIAVCLFLTETSISQTSNCDTSKILQTDKKLLEQFWTEFKTAVNTEDKVKLTSLINFSFDCDFCLNDSLSDYDYRKVTRELFDERQYKIFFDPKLKMAINKQPSLLKALFMTGDKANKSCTLSFGYTSVKPSKTWEGQQHFFSIEKIKNKFLITSAWTIP